MAVTDAHIYPFINQENSIAAFGFPMAPEKIHGEGEHLTDAERENILERNFLCLTKMEI